MLRWDSFWSRNEPNCPMTRAAAACWKLPRPVSCLLSFSCFWWLRWRWWWSSPAVLIDNELELKLGTIVVPTIGSGSINVGWILVGGCCCCWLETVAVGWDHLFVFGASSRRLIKIPVCGCCCCCCCFELVSLLFVLFLGSIHVLKLRNGWLDGSLFFRAIENDLNRRCCWFCCCCWCGCCDDAANSLNPKPVAAWWWLIVVVRLRRANSPNMVARSSSNLVSGVYKSRAIRVMSATNTSSSWWWSSPLPLWLLVLMLFSCCSVLFASPHRPSVINTPDAVLVVSVL